MSTQSKDIHIGSGYVYVYPFSGTIPADSTIEQSTYLLGYVKDGARITYKPTYRDIYNNEGIEQRSMLVKEEATLKFGVINWDANVFKKICSTATVSTNTTANVITASIGGVDYATVKYYVLRFVHQDGKHRVTMLGTNKDGFDIAYQSKSPAIVSASFKARPMPDGRLISYSESTI